MYKIDACVVSRDADVALTGCMALFHRAFIMLIDIAITKFCLSGIATAVISTSQDFCQIRHIASYYK